MSIKEETAIAPPGEQGEDAPGSASTGEDVYRQYQERSARYEADFRKETALWERIGNLRLLSFGLFVVALGVGLWQNYSPLQIAGLIFLAAFVVLVAYHRVVTRRRRRFEERWKINLEAGWRVRRDWANLPLRHTVRGMADEAYAADLDIFGHASLFHLLDTLTTHEAEQKLAAWLRAPASPAVVAGRQEGIAELAPLVDFRDELELRGRLINEERPDPERFLRWAESEPWLARRPWLRWGATVGVVLFWLLVAAQVFGLVDYPFWTVMAVLNIGFALIAGRGASSVLARAEAGEAGFRQYASAFELLCGQPFRSAALARVSEVLGAGGSGMDAPAYMRRLYRLTTMRIPPSAALYVPIQAVAMWDLHLLAALERWQRAAGKRARSWLDALGETEALSSLARLSHDNPHWAFPNLDPQAPALEAEELGHPLIPEDRRIGNDVEVGPRGTFLMVTGSNMSGKSTLLRAIGVNVVLAGAGGPVCASSMRLPPVDLWTSMRVEDSLERGVSYYMAELQRLKRVVDAARTDRGGDRTLLYLLDEILQGTNTTERQIAARRVILYLVRQGAIGAVSTHDLGLAEDPAIAAVARPVHFTENIRTGGSGPEMSFDYKLRPGIATSTNALRLLEIVGLDLGDGPAG